MPLPKKNLDDQPLQSLQAVHHLVKQSPLPLPEPLLKQIRTCLLSKSTTAATLSLEKEEEAIALLGNILETAATPSVSYSHRALACDTLSAWLIRSKTYPTLKPPLDEARGTEIWLRICHIVLANFEDASGALSKALKDLLSNTLATVGLASSRGTEVLRWLATNALQGINVGEGRKGGYYSLDVALRKGVGAEWVFSEYERLGLGAKSEQWKGEERLVNDLLQNLQDRNVCPAIGKALVSLLASRRTEIMKSGEAETTWLRSWEGPIKEALRQEDLRGRVQIYILPGLFKESSVCFERFVTGLGYAQSTGELSTSSEGHTSEEALGALLCCLSVGKDLAFVGEIGDDNQGKKASKHVQVELRAEFVEPLLAHAQPHIRLAALNLVSHCASISRPLSAPALQLLKFGFPYFHTESDPEIRDQVMAGIRSLTERLAASSYAAEKELKTLHSQLAKRTDQRPSPADLAQSHYLDSRIEDAKNFCIWYISYLRTLLHPGASYQRNITALRALTILIKSGVDASLADYAFSVSAGHGSTIVTGKVVKKGHLQWPEFASDIKIFEPETRKVLCNALFNPFTDVRAMAAETLRYAPVWTAGDLISVLEDGIDIMNQSGREKHADGVARLLMLMFELASRKQLEIHDVAWGVRMKAQSGLGVIEWILEVIDRQYLLVAEADFQIAVKTRPVYGLFGALGLILQRKDVYDNLSDEEAKTWRELHLRMFAACKSVWRITKGPLCYHAPEGHIPENLGDDDEDEDDMDSQTVMSYSWRAVKEMSGLLGLILQKAPCSESEPAKSTIKREDFRTYGELLLEQLSNIRHRGAFSAVSPAFVDLCKRCFRSEDAMIEELPQEWLRNNLQQILQKANVITRRSAGLPFLIVGILASEKDKSRPLMQSTFRRFVEIATMPAPNKADGEKMDLPQVHAMNCLKFLFTDARVSDAVAPFIGEALALAVSCFGSQIWAIRNCGVMLFTALTNRLFGTKRSRNEYLFTASAFTTKSFFEKYPSVRGVLLANLTEKVRDLEHGGSAAVEMVYPALSLIARLDASPDYQGMEDFRVLIKECMGSRIWKVREMSARAFATLVTPKECLDVIEKLLQVPAARRNRLHGNLCAVRALMERRLMQAIVEDRGNGENIWGRLFFIFAHRFSDLVTNNKCSINVGVMAQLINTNLPRLYKSPSLGPELLEQIASYIPTAEDFFKHIFTSSVIGQSFLKEYLASFTLTHFLLASVPTKELESLLLSTDDEIALFSRTTLAAHSPLPKLSDTTLRTLFEQAKSDSTYHLVRTATLNLLHALIGSTPSTPEFSILAAIIASPPNDQILAAALPLTGTFLPSHSIPQFTSTLAPFAHSSADYPLRAAALEAISSAAPQLDVKNEETIPLLVVLYGLLTDDDPDIRADTTTLVCSSRVLGLQHALLPDAAAAQLLAYLLRTFPTSAILWHQMVILLKGEKTVKDVLAARGQGVLFEVEKENLWRDEVEVAVATGKVLEGMKKAGFVGEEMERLREWVAETGRVLGDLEDEGGEELEVIRKRWEVARGVMV